MLRNYCLRAEPRAESHSQPPEFHEAAGIHSRIPRNDATNAEPCGHMIGKSSPQLASCGYRAAVVVGTRVDSVHSITS